MKLLARMCRGKIYDWNTVTLSVWQNISSNISSKHRIVCVYVGTLVSVARSFYGNGALIHCPTLLLSQLGLGPAAAKFGLWKIMELYGVPPKISTVIKRWYQNNEICVTNNGLQSDWMRIESGVKQGCGMSGFLFCLVLDWVMRNSVQGKNTGIRWKFMSKLEDLDFADDIALISSKINDIQAKTTAAKKWAVKAGLKFNIWKIKSMRLNTKIDRPIRIDGQELEDVDEFTYLGSKYTKKDKTLSLDCRRPGVRFYH